jgi:hypothetical protein
MKDLFLYTFEIIDEIFVCHTLLKFDETFVVMIRLLLLMMLAVVIPSLGYYSSFFFSKKKTVLCKTDLLK